MLVTLSGDCSIMVFCNDPGFANTRLLSLEAAIT